MIPNIIHFIFGLKEDFGGKPFSFIHYLAIKSAHQCNKPDAIKFHYKYVPKGEWWEKAKPYLTLVHVEPPIEIFGNPLLHFAHKADVMRLEILLKEGGIYLDLDVLCLNSFESLRKYKCVMGLERKVGLCNAVILAEKNSEFLKLWYESYKTFRSKGRDEFWGEHSVLMPYRIAINNKQLIHMEDKYSFFWPDYGRSLYLLWDKNPARSCSIIKRIRRSMGLKFIASAYCIHLWETVWWDKYLKEIDENYVKNNQNNLAKLARHVLSGNVRSQRPFQPVRNLMKALVKIYLK